MNNKFTEKMYRFMYGRYGADELYMFFTILSTVMLIADLIVGISKMGNVPKLITLSIITVLWCGIMAFTIYRMMSKQIAKRRHENEIYLKALGAVKRIFTLNTSAKSKSNNTDDSSYIFRDCNKCCATLRLPRKSGRHKVKCPRCSHKFYVYAKKYKSSEK